jgi:fatty acid omega-hydroxylase
LKGIPGLKQWPVIGCMFELLRNLDNQQFWWLENTKKYGLVWYGWCIGQPPLVLVMDPKSVEWILKDNFSNYPKGPNFQYRLQDLLGGGIFNVDGSEWKTQRFGLKQHYSSFFSLYSYMLCFL